VWARGLAPRALIGLGLLVGCGGSKTTALIHVHARDEASRPQYALVDWVVPDGPPIVGRRFPPEGDLPAGLDLGTIQIELDDTPGDRRVTLHGQRDGAEISAGTATVPWKPGITQTVSVTLARDAEVPPVTGGLDGGTTGGTGGSSGASGGSGGAGGRGTPPPEADAGAPPPPTDGRPATPDAPRPAPDAPGDPRPASPDTGPPPGLVVSWNFGEGTGLVAHDTSPFNNFGTLMGTTNMVPSWSTDAPAQGGGHSLAFVRAQRNAVNVGKMAAGTNLPGATAATLMAWFRASTVDTQGADLISFGDVLVLRLKSNGLQASKMIGNQVWSICPLPVTVLDGKWHHAAGVMTGTSVVIVVDGRSMASCNNTQPIAYMGTTELWAGRNGTTQSGYDFEGNLDEVRVFVRALSLAEIKAVAGL
jgi:hypothetical protein